jgi:hypothetical protein
VLKYRATPPTNQGTWVGLVVVLLVVMYQISATNVSASREQLAASDENNISDISDENKE